MLFRKTRQKEVKAPPAGRAAAAPLPGAHGVSDGADFDDSDWLLVDLEDGTLDTAAEAELETPYHAGMRVADPTLLDDSSPEPMDLDYGHVTWRAKRTHEETEDDRHSDGDDEPQPTRERQRKRSRGLA